MTPRIAQVEPVGAAEMPYVVDHPVSRRDETAATAEPTVFVIEPEAATRESIAALVRRMDLCCETYANGNDFLSVFNRRRPGCLILELRLPGLNGLQIQQRLEEMQAAPPTIFLTTAASVSIAVHAMRAGALHFLEKPFHEHELWFAIQEAMQNDCKRCQERALRESIHAQLKLLSEKEMAVLELMAHCKAKHAMAEELGVSLRSVEYYRTQLMRKLKTKSIAGLIHFALTAKHTGFHLQAKARAANHDGNDIAAEVNALIAGNGFHLGSENDPQPETWPRRSKAK